MPISGAPAAKSGYTYEDYWLVQQFIRLMKGEADCIELDPLGARGDGVEFIVTAGDIEEFHQNKEQNGHEARWSIGDLSPSILPKLLKQLRASPTAEVWFVSGDRVRGLSEMVGRARDAENLADFRTLVHKSAKFRDHYEKFLELELVQNHPTAWDYLKRTYNETVTKDGLLRNISSVLDGLTGSQGSTAVATLIQFSKGVGHRIVWPEDVWGALKSAGISRPLALAPHPMMAIEEATEHYLGSLSKGGFRSHFTKRKVVADVLSKLDDGACRIWLKGSAGAGKSEVVRQLVTALRERGTPTLALRVDELSAGRPINEQLRINDALNCTLSTLGHQRAVRSVLIVDQLDATSELSGRMISLFPLVRRLLDDCSKSSNLSLIVVCRAFDLREDLRLRELPNANRDTTVTVGPFNPRELQDALGSLGVNLGRLTHQERELLAVPLHLRLYAECLEGGKKPPLLTSVFSLYEAFWSRKLTKKAAVRVAERMARWMDEHRELSCPVSELGANEDYEPLISGNVLVRSDRRARFFHQTFFDYAWVRTTRVHKKLRNWLLKGEQGLFRRAQLRTALRFLRADHPKEATAHLAFLLGENNAKVRFHLKKVAALVLQEASQPTVGERSAVWKLIDSSDAAHRRLGWSTIWNKPVWFREAVDDGRMATWMASDDAETSRSAANLAGLMGREEPEAAAKLLTQRSATATPNVVLKAFFRDQIVWGFLRPPLIGHALRAVADGALDADEVMECLRWFLLKSSRHASDEWFELLAAMVQSILAHGLGNTWFGSTAGGASDFRSACEERPHAALKHLVPIASQLTENDLEGTWPRPHTTSDSVVSALICGVQYALAAANPEHASSSCTTLWERQQAPSSVLVLLALTRRARLNRPVVQGAWVGEVITRGLLESAGEFTRETALAFVASHETALRAEEIRSLEELAKQLASRPPRSGQRATHWKVPAVELLRALGDNALSGSGLSLLRRLDRAAPWKSPEPTSLLLQAPTQQFNVVSPVSYEETLAFTDTGWLAAMREYSSDRGSGLTGGATQFARVLRQRTSEEPERFCALFLQMPQEINVAYPNAILAGLLPNAKNLLPPRTAAHAVVGTALFREDFMLDALQVVRTRSDWDWPREVCTQVQQLACEHPGDGSVAHARLWDGKSTYSPLQLAYTCVAGAAAIAWRNMLLAQDAPLKSLLATGRALSRRSVPIRAAAAEFLLDLARAKHWTAGVQLLLELCDGCDDAVLLAPAVSEFLRHLPVEHWESIDELLERAIRSEDPVVQRIGGRQIACFAGMGAEKAQQRITALLDSPVADVRLGLAGVLADNTHHVLSEQPALWPAWSTWLEKLLHDPDGRVRFEAGKWTRHVEERGVSGHEHLLRSLLGSPAARQGGRDHLRTLAKLLLRRRDHAETPTGLTIDLMHELTGALFDGLQEDSQAPERPDQFRGDMMRLGGDLTSLLWQVLKEAPPEEEPGWLDRMDWLAMMDARDLDARMRKFDRAADLAAPP